MPILFGPYFLSACRYKHSSIKPADLYTRKFVVILYTLLNGVNNQGSNKWLYNFFSFIKIKMSLFSHSEWFLFCIHNTGENIQSLTLWKTWIQNRQQGFLQDFLFCWNEKTYRTHWQIRSHQLL